jgi:hypothetical protein
MVAPPDAVRGWIHLGKLVHSIWCRQQRCGIGSIGPATLPILFGRDNRLALCTGSECPQCCTECGPKKSSSSWGVPSWPCLLRYVWKKDALILWWLSGCFYVWWTLFCLVSYSLQFCVGILANRGRWICRLCRGCMQWAIYGIRWTNGGFLGMVGHVGWEDPMIGRLLGMISKVLQMPSVSRECTTADYFDWARFFFIIKLLVDWTLSLLEDFCFDIFLGPYRVWNLPLQSWFLCRCIICTWVINWGFPLYTCCSLECSCHVCGANETWRPANNEGQICYLRCRVVNSYTK